MRKFCRQPHASAGLAPSDDKHGALGDGLFGGKRAQI